MSVHEKLDAGPIAPHARVKVVQVGNSLGLVLPRELLTRLKVGKGDNLFLVESPDGVTLTPYDPAVAAQVEAGQRFMRKYRDTFRALAK